MNRINLKPYLIKPNEEEVAAYIGRNAETFGTAACLTRGTNSSQKIDV